LTFVFAVPSKTTETKIPQRLLENEIIAEGGGDGEGGGKEVGEEEQGV